MVVACPKCKSRLKIADEKISLEGSRFKCPKCTSILLVKKPVKKEIRGLATKKIMIAHADPSVIERAKSAISPASYEILTATDGVDMMIKTLRELPHIVIVDVALPKIYGFEACKRLRDRDETKEIKLILISSIYDKKRYRREPCSLYGADDYIDEHLIEEELLKKVKSLTGPKEEMPHIPEEKPPVSPPLPLKAVAPAVEAPLPKIKPADEMIEKAKRLSRIILSDIYLYSAAKVENAIRNNKFKEVFAPELKEGLKLYESRILPETRSKGNFYEEEIETFINIRKKSLGLD